MKIINIKHWLYCYHRCNINSISLSICPQRASCISGDNAVHCSIWNEEEATITVIKKMTAWYDTVEHDASH